MEARLACFVSDLDVAGAYPHTQWALNMESGTTWRELCKVRGLSDKRQREVGLNMTAANTNAVEICRTVFNYPSMARVLKEFEKTHKEAA